MNTGLYQNTALFVWASWSAGPQQGLNQWCEFGTRERSKRTQNVMFANPNVFFPADARKRAQQWKRGHQHWRWSHRMEDQVLQLNRHTQLLTHTHTHTHNLFFSLSLSLSLIPHFCLTLFRSVLLTGFSVINTLSNVSHTHDCLLTFVFLKKTM